MPSLEYVFLLAQSAFVIWMLVDAYRRSADTMWFWVILFFPGIGAWIYFFAVKWGDFSTTRLWPLGQRRPSLDELRYRAEQTPTLASRLELAQGLMERANHVEAIPLLEAARKQEPDHPGVLFALATCFTEQGHPEQSLPLLDQIIARDRAWSDYAAWRLLVATRAQGGDSAGALNGCRDLVRLAPTLHHRCLLAERLLAEGMNDEARDVVEEALEDHRYAPGPLRRRNRTWASHARRLQKRLRVTTGA